MATLSFSARLHKRLTRRILRPLLNPNVPLEMQRRGLQWVAKSTLKPRGMCYQELQVANVKTFRVHPKSINPEPTVRSQQHAILYCHGGAYIVGSPAVYAGLIAHISKRAHLPVYALDYRLAPEHPFPAGLDDARAVYQRLRQDYARVTVIGDSAGGGLAMALALSLRDAGETLPDELVLFSPLVDLECNSSSYARYAKTDVVLTQDWLLWATQFYRGNLAADHSLCSPLYNDMEGLPRTLIQVGEDEVLLQDSKQLAEKMRQAGVDVHLKPFPQCWHVFQSQAGLVPEAAVALDEVTEFLQR